MLLFLPLLLDSKAARDEDRNDIVDFFFGCVERSACEESKEKKGLHGTDDLKHVDNPH